MNWRMWFYYWRICSETYWGYISTPWFALEVRTGSDWQVLFAHWFGLRLHYGHPSGWNIEEGAIMFTRVDDTLSWTPRQRWIDAAGFAR